MHDQDLLSVEEEVLVGAEGAGAAAGFAPSVLAAGAPSLAPVEGAEDVAGGSFLLLL